MHYFISSNLEAPLFLLDQCENMHKRRKGPHVRDCVKHSTNHFSEFPYWNGVLKCKSWQFQRILSASALSWFLRSSSSSIFWFNLMILSCSSRRDFLFPKKPPVSVPLRLTWSPVTDNHTIYCNMNNCYTNYFTTIMRGKFDVNDKTIHHMELKY